MIRRLGEQRCFSVCKCLPADESTLTAIEHHHGSIPKGFENAYQFVQLKYGHFLININRSAADCCVVIKGIGPVLTGNVLRVNGSVHIVCHPLLGLTDLFMYPLPSSSIGIYKATGLSKHAIATVVAVSDIVCKCICIPCDPQKTMYPGALFLLNHSLVDEHA